MPGLARPEVEARIALPAREARLAGAADVLVVGGGPAGLGAALGAAAAGAQVILAERYSFLGGNATAALVMPLMSFHAQHPPVEHSEAADLLLPSDHTHFGNSFSPAFFPPSAACSISALISPPIRSAMPLMYIHVSSTTTAPREP